MGDQLLWAVKNGDLEAVKQTFDKTGFEVNVELTGGRNALHFAADYGHVDIIEYLISKGANVNLKDKHGITPLLAAIYEEHTDCVKMLLKSGAKTDGKAPDGSSYIDCANVEIKDLLK